jgi:hypothetical protein
MKVLTDAGVTSLCAVSALAPLPRALRCQDPAKSGAPASPFSGLPEILMRGVELGRDQRDARSPRLRRALKGGQVVPNPVKVQCQPETHAVDPQLPEAMKARMSAPGR